MPASEVATRNQQYWAMLGNSPTTSILEMRNDYESQLMQKDVEIGALQAKLTSIRTIVGGAADNDTVQTFAAPSRGAELWLKKFGSSGAGKIMRLLLDNPGRRFTRQQIALAVGLKLNTGNFRNSLSRLRTARVMVEQDGLMAINPDL